METKEMAEIMLAEAQGKKIEESKPIRKKCWKPFQGIWDWKNLTFRIAPEQSIGVWKRVEVRRGSIGYYLNDSDASLIDACPRITGFGGIEYLSPFDTAIVIRSMVPVMFDEKGCASIWRFSDNARPGIPIAAWFWRNNKGS